MSLRLIGLLLRIFPSRNFLLVSFVSGVSCLQFGNLWSTSLQSLSVDMPRDSAGTVTAPLTAPFKWGGGTLEAFSHLSKFRPPAGQSFDLFHP
jgi:hypothetical protein